jgi:hypothetical protein
VLPIKDKVASGALFDGAEVLAKFKGLQPDRLQTTIHTKTSSKRR